MLQCCIPPNPESEPAVLSFWSVRLIFGQFPVNCRLVCCCCFSFLQSSSFPFGPTILHLLSTSHDQRSSSFPGKTVELKLFSKPEKKHPNGNLNTGEHWPFRKAILPTKYIFDRRWAWWDCMVVVEWRAGRNQPLWRLHLLRLESPKAMATARDSTVRLPDDEARSWPA